MKQDTRRHRGKIRYGLLLTSLGGLLYTFDLPLLRLSGLDTWTLMFARGVLLFFAITLVWCVSRLVKKDDMPLIAGGAGLAVIVINAVAGFSYVGAIKSTPAANVVFILAITPLITVFLSRIFMGEKAHPFTWSAVAICFLATGTIVRDSLAVGSVLGDLLALLCAVCMAATLTIIRASGKNLVPSLGLGSLLSAIVVLLFFDVAPNSLFNIAAMGMPAWFWVALNGLVAIPLALSLVAQGPRYLPSVDVSMFFLLETVLTPLWVWLLLAEAPSSSVLVGGAIIIVTLFAHSVWRARVGLNQFRKVAIIYD